MEGSERGLTDEAADRRLARDGPNRLRAIRPVAWWMRLLRQFSDPLLFPLFAAIIVAALIWVLDGAIGLPVDAIVIVAIVLLDAVIGAVQARRAADAVAALRRMTAPVCTVLRAGVPRQLAADQVVVGDLLLLREGDAIPADARLIAVAGLQTQESSLTGESGAVDKTDGTLDVDVGLPDRRNMVFRGTAVVLGTGRAVVTATGMRTELGAIAGELTSAAEPSTPLEREVRRLGRILALLGVAAAVLLLVLLLLTRGGDTADITAMLLLAVALAVAVVPEGLPAVITLILALGSVRLARRNAIVTSLSAVEALGAASVICTDKTGTLTRNEMVLDRIDTAAGTLRIGPPGAAGVPDERRRLAELTLRIACLASETRVGASGTPGAQVRGDPTEVAIQRAALAAGMAPALDDYRRLATMTFTSERKMMSTVQVDQATGRRFLYCKGAPDVLLERCIGIREADGEASLDADRRQALLDRAAALAGDAYRTIGVAYRALDEAAPADADAERDLVFVGILSLVDPPRPEVKPAIRTARRAGIRTVMITGDHPATARRIASDLGIDDGAVPVSAAQIDGMTDDELTERVRRTGVFARIAPHHKVRIVAALQRTGAVVAMTGDGVNDAPALERADIGIAMGITGTDVAKSAANIVLADDDFATIVAAIRQGRVIFDNLRKCLRYLLTSNLAEVLTVLIAVAAPALVGLPVVDQDGHVTLPLLATQILWVNLITDSAPALALGVDRETGDPMRRPPRSRAERIVGRTMLLQVAGIGLVMAAATLLAMDMQLPAGLVDGTGGLELARTAGFTTLTLAQLFDAFNARSTVRSAFRRPFDNPWLWASCGLGLLLQIAVVELPFLNAAFGTTPMGLTNWLICLALASSVLWLSEGAKAAGRLLRWRGTRS